MKKHHMRLGFHYHIPAVYKNDGIYMTGVLGRFIDSLAEFCDQVVCFLHTPRSEEFSSMDYRIISDNVRLINIGVHTSVMKRTLRSKIYTSFLLHYASEMDLLLLRGPSPLLPAMASASPVPTALLLVGDYIAGINDLPQPCWRKEVIRMWSYWNKWGQNHAAHHSLTFVNSRVLYDELKDKTPHLHEVRTTTLTKDDFFIRSDTCQTRPYRLLYVGRMDRAKGLRQMVEAVSQLTEHGEEVTLDLVGWPVRGDSILEEIRTWAIEKNISEKIHYLGPRQLGTELFECYKRADIFVIASYSEGFPRVIWEAMAHSLPVIATRVGGIPGFIEGKAELIEPRSVDALVDAIQHLIHDEKLRQKYIQAGFSLAKENTLDKQAQKIMEYIEKEIR